MKLVWVEWLDSSAPFRRTTWVDKDEFINPTPLTVYTVGWLVKEGPETIILASSLDDKDLKKVTQASGVLEIPKAAIVEIRALRRGKKEPCLHSLASSLPSSEKSSTGSPATSEIEPKPNK